MASIRRVPLASLLALVPLVGCPAGGAEKNAAGAGTPSLRTSQKEPQAPGATPQSGSGATPQSGSGPASKPVPRGAPTIPKEMLQSPYVPERPPLGMEPKIVFDHTSHDFGSLDEGAVRSAEFKFRNEGAGPLVITGVFPSCPSCSVGSIEVGGQPYVLREPIPPDTEGVVRIKLDTSGYPGEKRVFITMFTNDPSTPEAAEGPFGIVKLDVKAQVQRLFEFDPPVADLQFGPISTVESPTQSIVLRSTKNEAFQIVGFQPFDPMVDVQVVALDATAQRWQLRVTILPGMPFGSFVKEITVQTRPEAPNLKLYARGIVRGPVHVDPPQLNFLVVHQGRVAAKSVSVRNGDARYEMAVQGLRLLDPMDQRSMLGGDARDLDRRIADHLLLKVVEEEPGKAARIEVVVKETMPAGTFNTVLAFHTGVPGGMKGPEEIRMPIVGVVR